MRQAETSRADGAKVGHCAERSTTGPDVYLYRGRAGDGADCLVTFDRRTVLVARQVAGLACRIRVGMACYDAVAVRDRGNRHVVSLWHSDPGLSIDLADFDTSAAAEQTCAALISFTGLEPLILSGFGRQDSEAEDAFVPAPRRKGPGGERRPRFLKRRQSGVVVALRPRGGRDLIARS